MAWYSDYNQRKERLLRDGLLVLVRGAHVDADTGFAAVYLEANEGDLLRSNTERGFDLHITLGYAADYGRGVAEECAAIINKRWRGRLVRLRVGWVGSGGSAQLAEDDELASDDYIVWLHSRGWYSDRPLHVSL